MQNEPWSLRGKGCPSKKNIPSYIASFSHYDIGLETQPRLLIFPTPSTDKDLILLFSFRSIHTIQFCAR